MICVADHCSSKPIFDKVVFVDRELFLIRLQLINHFFANKIDQDWALSVTRVSEVLKLFVLFGDYLVFEYTYFVKKICYRANFLFRK